jgi:2-oxo-4-hydroxy-4-carboxy-5-ureidoimidazoline decarboxylase
MSTADAWQMLMQCCTAESWVEAMVAGRPYTNEQALYESANQYWQDLSEEDYLQAFAGHPQIGDIDSLQSKYANTKALAAGEQSSVTQADSDVINALAQGNRDYLEKFGFIFIVCATGKSATEMLALLQQRLCNNRSSELANAAEQQRKIFQLRLRKLL